MKTKSLVSTSSFIASLIVLLASNYGFEKVGWNTTGIAVYSGGFLLGMLLGIVFGKRYALRIAAWAFLPSCILALPVVIATYGFAVLGAPLLLLYGGVVYLAARLQAE
jgi:uncharacterized PurR-regulated membrane protein YhhQ (DUF165 family)